MSSDRNTFAVCGDCCKHLALSDASHTCLPMMRRKMMERMESMLTSFEAGDDGIGLLWLVRVIYRERRKMSGIEKYADRAALARRVCALLEGE